MAEPARAPRDPHVSVDVTEYSLRRCVLPNPSHLLIFPLPCLLLHPKPLRRAICDDQLLFGLQGGPVRYHGERHALSARECSWPHSESRLNGVPNPDSCFLPFAADDFADLVDVSHREEVYGRC